MRREKDITITEVIRKRRVALALKQGYISLLLKMILFLIVSVIFLKGIFLITQANGNDMFPAIKDGDLVIGFRLQKIYKADDVVIYEVDGKRCIGRIVAIENDTVMMDENGKLVVNEMVQSDEILYPSYAKDGNIEYPYQVSQNKVFILGDFRTQSIDSRDFGAVSIKDIQGKVITILRRRGI